MSQVSYDLLFQETKSPCAVTRETRALKTRKEATRVTIFVSKIDRNKQPRKTIQDTNAFAISMSNF